MWLMTPFGILMPAIRPAASIEAGDNREIQVRARRRREIEILRAEYMGDQLGPTLFTPDFDYEYRAYCTHEAFARAAYDIMMSIDYLKFKPTTDRYKDDELHRVYNAIWGTMFSTMSTKQHQREYMTGKSNRKSDVKQVSRFGDKGKGKNRGRGNRWGQGVEEYLDATGYRSTGEDQEVPLGAVHSSLYGAREIPFDEDIWGDLGDENFGQQWNTTGGDWTKEPGISEALELDEDERERVDSLIRESGINLGKTGPTPADMPKALPAPVVKSQIGDSMGETLGQSYTRRAKAKRPGAVLPSEIAPRKVKKGQDRWAGVAIDHTECEHAATSASQKQCRALAIQAWEDAQRDSAKSGK